MIIISNCLLDEHIRAASTPRSTAAWTQNTWRGPFGPQIGAEGRESAVARGPQTLARGLAKWTQLEHAEQVQLAQDFESIPIDAVQMHPANPRRGDLDAITDSIAANGFFGACVVQRSTKYILIGNHRWLAAREAGEQTIPVLWVDVDDEQARRMMVADNRTAELASWDMEALQAVLSELNETDTGLVGVGFTEDDLADLIDELNQPERDPTVLPSANVLIDDPQHEVTRGEVYRLGPHVLVVGTVTLDWPLWLPYLVEGVVFCPHPSPYLPLSHAVDHGNLLMVTANAYLAGHVLDKWESNGGDIQLETRPAA